MYPVNHYMDPYHSHYRNHAPYPYYPPPGWEIPSGLPPAMDSSYYRPPSSGPWPYNAAVHHPHPSEFHCCCSRIYPLDYYSFRPSSPQDLPPPHLYYHGPLPQHPNPCPSYSVPSYPYPVDQTSYGYNKFKSHCCGCPNHVCPAEKSNVKIEEGRPDVKPENEQEADSSTIIRYPNNQYPFMWLPSGNMTGKENGKHYELSPQILNGWAPVKNKRTGDVNRQEQDNQKEKQFQWPIVWMPAGYDEPKQNAKEINGMEEIPKTPNISEEAPQSPKIKIIPLSWFENGHHYDQQSTARNGSGDHSNRSAVKNQPVVSDHHDGGTLEGIPKTIPTVSKSVNNESRPIRENCKTIPIVPEKEVDEKKASTYRTIPVMKEIDEKTGMSEKKEAKEANNAEKLEEKRKTKHSDSSVDKRSKLPPVCLRVDPLPRKKSGNGSLRSPSPPTQKDDDKAKKDMEAQNRNMEPKQSGTNKCITVSEVKEKSPDEMKKEIGFSNETVQAASVENSQEEEAPTSKDDQKVQAGSTMIGAQGNTNAMSMQGGAAQENAGAENLNGCDKSKNMDGMVIESEVVKDDVRTCRVNLSEPDAAVRIQSAYRGYDVRRWQPLDKLQKIRHVHEQMQGVKKQLQCLEDSCNKPTQKEQVAISETIMTLLLKLDSIQGLHPSVREARKSVSRELVCLQEKLDTLCKQPSGELNHTNSNEEESERVENIIQTAVPTITTEASDREERAIEQGKVEPCSVDFMEPCNAVASEVRKEVRPDTDASEQKNEKELSYHATMDGTHEGKTEGQVEFQVAQSSMDIVSEESFTEQPTDKEHEIGESYVISVEQVTQEENPVVEGEGKEGPLVNSMGPLQDTASSGDSSGLKQCTVMADQDLYAESSTGFSPASTENFNISALTESGESGVATEKDVPVDSQVHETAALESMQLKDFISSANQQNKSSSPIHLEDSQVPLMNVEQHGLTPANESVSYTEDQQEARNISLQVQAVESMQDSGKVPDGTPEISTDDDDLELGASADVEKHDQPALLEPTLESISDLELSVLEESDDKMRCGVSSKHEIPHVDEKTESTEKLSEGSANGEDPLGKASRKDLEILESHPSLEKEADDPRGGTVLPDSDKKISCAHCGGITVYEGPEMVVSPESHTGAEKENISSVVSQTDECTQTRKAAPVVTEGANSAEDADLRVSEMDKCNETLKDATSHATGANPTEEEASLKDVAVPIENKASEEATSVSLAPDDPKVSDEEKLAEENQKLKELLQKLLASGNDQMGVITNLSDKVKALERKLARKKKPKVKVHRPSRHSTATIH